jgi:hypothetical protein
MKSAIIKCLNLLIENVERNAPDLNADEICRKVFSDGALKPPLTATIHFNTILSELLKMSKRNFNIYQGYYCDIYNKYKNKKT